MVETNQLIRQNSISQVNWTNYVFSAHYTFMKYLCMRSIPRRTRAYIWFKMNYNETTKGDEPFIWWKRVQRLKQFLYKLIQKQRTNSFEQIQRNNAEDLLGMPIDPETCLYLYQDGVESRYSLDDIIGILQMSLEQKEEFTPKPRIPCDPYTNKEWSIPILYKVQGWLRKQKVNIANIPLSILMWIKTPYVVQNIFTSKSQPYLLTEYLHLRTKYAFMQEITEDRDAILSEMQDIAETLGIRLENVDWISLSSMNFTRFKMIWESFLSYWYHPCSEWTPLSTVDDRNINWKLSFIDHCKQSKCWNNLYGRKMYRIRRKRRIGLR